jgi:hypothetical protein
MSDNGLISKIHSIRDSTQKQEKRKFYEQWAKDLSRHFSKEDIRMSLMVVTHVEKLMQYREDQVACAMTCALMRWSMLLCMYASRIMKPTKTTKTKRGRGIRTVIEGVNWIKVPYDECMEMS